ncbi:EpsG family protein [Anaerostipes faecalis]|uniref:EpsG family protein n=1 Tax=Anaerostipes faecalis TaxID=2738446 RepID=UPI003EFFD742
MIFQWQLFVLLIVVAILTPLMGQRVLVNVYGEKQIHYTWLPVMAIAIPLIYMAGTRVRTLPDFGDTTSYLLAYRNAPTSLTELIASFTEDTKDKGFEVFTSLVKAIVGEREILYFALIATICILCVVITYKKYSCNFIISMFLFLASGDYIQWNFNGIRQFIAIAVIFACTGLMLKKKYVQLIIIILLISTIHASALIMLPMIFIVQGKALNKKTLLFAATIILAIAFVDQFTDLVTNFMENSQYSGEVDQYLSTEGTNILRVLVYSVPAALTVLFKKYIDKADNPVINLSSNMCLCTSFAMILSGFTSGLFIGRIAAFYSLYNYITIPWIVEHVFTKNSARIIYITMIGFYMAFYYYQVHVTWGL